MNDLDKAFKDENEKELYLNYIKPYFKKNFDTNKIEELMILDWYKIFYQFIPGLIYCYGKRYNSQEMSLFDEEDPNIEDFGFTYRGPKDFEGCFWASVDDAMKFIGDDFWVRVYSEPSTKSKKAQHIRFNDKDDRGFIITRLRGGNVGVSNMIEKGNHDIYDKLVDPSSMGGGCVLAKLVHRFKDWTRHKMERDTDFNHAP